MKFEAYEASSAQKRLYIVDRLQGESILYNMPKAWIIEGHLDPIRLDAAVRELIRRHETLRTCFVSIDGEVFQKVYEDLDFKLKYSEPGKTTKDVDAIIDGFIKPFDLSEVPLWKIELVQLEPGKRLLMIDIHHIISDGVSMGVLIEDLMSLYDKFQN